ncbi:hypothetical protein WJX73_008044 [Symbiochloris irregularis]|uniref:Uncharacterized protein n=1 Tax=Symbiochloris irregularis TaxID=706552 RepID=A0AAW1PQY5_9CHLO
MVGRTAARVTGGQRLPPHEAKPSRDTVPSPAPSQMPSKEIARKAAAGNHEQKRHGPGQFGMSPLHGCNDAASTVCGCSASVHWGCRHRALMAEHVLGLAVT